MKAKKLIKIFFQQDLNDFKDSKNLRRKFQLLEFEDLMKIRFQVPKNSFKEFLILDEAIRKARNFEQAERLNKTIPFDSELKIQAIKKELKLTENRAHAFTCWINRDKSSPILGLEILNKIISLSSSEVELEEIEKIIEKQSLSMLLKEKIFTKKTMSLGSFRETEVFMNKHGNTVERKIKLLHIMLKKAQNETELKKVAKMNTFASLKFKIYQKAHVFSEREQKQQELVS